MRIGPDLSSHTTLRFYVLGDFGSGDRFQTKVAEALAFMASREPPDFILSTGDCLYLIDEKHLGATSQRTVLEERFEPYYAPLGVDFFQCLGNHDVLDIFGGDTTAMLDYTQRSAVWRLPSSSYRVPELPSWITIHVAYTSVFGFGPSFAEKELFSARRMADEVSAVKKSFAGVDTVKILVGHHPVLTAGKRTFRYDGDGVVGYMRPLRRALQESGVHFYFSGHEHHQSHITGGGCEYVIQGCGGEGARANPKHPRREDGWRDADKVLRFLDVCNGFAIVDVDASREACVRFFGIQFDEPAASIREIYAFDWSMRSPSCKSTV